MGEETDPAAILLKAEVSQSMLRSVYFSLDWQQVTPTLIQSLGWRVEEWLTPSDGVQGACSLSVRLRGADGARYCPILALGGQQPFHQVLLTELMLIRYLL